MNEETLVLKVETSAMTDGKRIKEMKSMPVVSKGKISVPENVESGVRLVLICAAMLTAIEAATEKFNSYTDGKHITVKDLLGIIYMSLEDGSIQGGKLREKRVCN